MPDPAILFVWLCVGVIALSALLSWADIKVTYQVVESPPVPVTEIVNGGSTQPSGGLPDASVQEGEYWCSSRQTASIQSLLSADGIRFIFTSFVANFQGFGVVAVTFIAMMGAGVAEATGMMNAMIRKMVAVSPGQADHLPHRPRRRAVEPRFGRGLPDSHPPGRRRLSEPGRHPIAGMAAGFAGVAGTFAVNLIPQPIDAMMTEVANEAIGLTGGSPMTVVANYFFTIVSTLFLCVVITIVTERMIEPRPRERHGTGSGSGERRQRAPH